MGQPWTWTWAVVSMAKNNLKRLMKGQVEGTDVLWDRVAAHYCFC
jgi:hypothetical protein